VREREPAERQARVAPVQVEPARSPDDETELAALMPPFLEPAAQLDRVELAPVAGQQHEMRPLRDAARHAFVRGHLDQLDAREPGEHLAVVLHVVL
jgi:hypothetical protein